MAKLTKKDLKTLKDLTNTIQSWLSQNPDLAGNLRLWDKFYGQLGEAFALMELSEKLSSKELEFEWFGGRKHNYDLAIKNRSGKKLKVQVKASHEGQSFRPFTYEDLGEDERDAIAKEYQTSSQNFTLPNNIAKILDHQVDERFVEGNNEKFFWIFASTSEQGNEFFILDKQELKSLLKQDYEKYVGKTKHGKRFNYAITKQKKIMIILNTHALKDYKDKWDKINNSLS